MHPWGRRRVRHEGATEQRKSSKALLSGPFFPEKKNPSQLQGQEAGARGQDWVCQEWLSLEEAAGLVVP